MHNVSHDTAFLGAGTVFGNYWTKHRYFDYLIDKENFKLAFGRSFRMMVFLDPAIANGPAAVRADAEGDTRTTDYLIHRLGDIRPELTVFVTTADMLAPEADENTPTLKQSDDPYTNNRIKLYEAVNYQYGRVLNVHVPSIARATPEFNPLLHALTHPEQQRKELPFAPLEYHQLYLPERILLDVEKCIPLGIPSLIPAVPPLTTTELVAALAPSLRGKLRDPRPEDPVGSRRTTIHHLQWVPADPGYVVTREDEITLLQFYLAPEIL